MMSMHFPYGNTNTTGQHSYGPAVCPSFGINYNPYISPTFYSNSNGLLPTPIIPLNQSLNNRECKELIPKTLITNSYPPSFQMPYGPKQMNNSKDFLTFIEQKPQPLTGLNPYANEFSLEENSSSNTFIPTKQEKISSYKLIFDDLIEKSLRSIDAIEKASKIIAHQHVSIQCDQSIEQINRSTQTHHQSNHYYLLEEYSSSAMKLIENLKNLLENSSLNTISDELYQIIIIMNQLIRSSIDQDNNSKYDCSFPSSSMINNRNVKQHRLISSTPSITSEMIDPITIKRLKQCLLCQKALDYHDDLMHPFCRLFSSPPDTLIHQ